MTNSKSLTQKETPLFIQEILKCEYIIEFLFAEHSQNNNVQSQEKSEPNSGRNWYDFFIGGSKKVKIASTRVGEKDCNENNVKLTLYNNISCIADIQDTKKFGANLYQNIKYILCGIYDKNNMFYKNVNALKLVKIIVNLIIEQDSNILLFCYEDNGNILTLLQLNNDFGFLTIENTVEENNISELKLLISNIIKSAQEAIKQSFIHNIKDYKFELSKRALMISNDYSLVKEFFNIALDPLPQLFLLREYIAEIGKLDDISYEKHQDIITNILLSINFHYNDKTQIYNALQTQDPALVEAALPEKYILKNHLQKIIAHKEDLKENLQNLLKASLNIIELVNLAIFCNLDTIRGDKELLAKLNGQFTQGFANIEFLKAMYYWQIFDEQQQGLILTFLQNISAILLHTDGSSNNCNKNMARISREFETNIKITHFISNTEFIGNFVHQYDNRVANDYKMKLSNTIKTYVKNIYDNLKSDFENMGVEYGNLSSAIEKAVHRYIGFYSQNMDNKELEYIDLMVNIRYIALKCYYLSFKARESEILKPNLITSAIGMVPVLGEISKNNLNKERNSLIAEILSNFYLEVEDSQLKEIAFKSEREELKLQVEKDGGGQQKQWSKNSFDIGSDPAIIEAVYSSIS